MEIYCNSFAQMIRTRLPHEIVIEYRKRLRNGKEDILIAFNTLRENTNRLPSCLVCQLINITAYEGTLDLLRDILMVLQRRLVDMDEMYIIDYISNYNQRPRQSIDACLESFSILWDTYVKFRPISLFGYRNILKHFVRVIGLYSSITNGVNTIIIFAKAIIDRLDAAALGDYLTQSILFRLGCYDISFEFPKYLRSLNCRISNLPREYRKPIIEEFTHTRRSFSRLTMIVNYLLDESICLSELYPLYTWAISKHMHDYECMHYLIDIGIWIPVSERVFFTTIYGHDGYYNPDDIMFTILREMFKSPA